MIDLINHVRLI